MPARSPASAKLDLALLGLLEEQDLHGYELRRRLGELLGPIGRLSFGTLYPALNRLEADGAVTVLKVSESRTGLTTTRGRKIYGITKAGRSRFEELVTSTPTDDDDRTFALRLAFARHLSHEARLRLLMRRRDQLTERLQEANETLEHRRNRLDDYSTSVMEHAVEMANADIAWVDCLIAREQKSPTSKADNKTDNTDSENHINNSPVTRRGK